MTSLRDASLEASLLCPGRETGQEVNRISQALCMMVETCAGREVKVRPPALSMDAAQVRTACLNARTDLYFGGLGARAALSVNSVGVRQKSKARMSLRQDFKRTSHTR